MKAFDPTSRVNAHRILPLLLLAGGWWAQACFAGTVATSDPQGVRTTPVTPVITEEDIAKAQRKYPMPSDADLSRVPLPAAPRLETLPRPATPRSVDLGALAKGYEANQEKVVEAQGLMA